MRFEKKRMVGWYDVKQLASTAVKTVVSGVFGNYADKREIQAFADQGPYFDFSKKDEIWVDYISDLGDGFSSTYTMAHLMSTDKIEVSDKELPRGELLIMGGDEVYPTPEMKEYKNRLQGPYNAAFPWKRDEAQSEKPRLFAIPGNHDWYDGLTNFIRLFCQGRALGNRLTEQKRSYFALKLPCKYWLLGIDIQLKGDIDDPQMAYFRNAAENHFESGDKVILCTAEPTWVYASLTDDFEADNRLNFFIDRVLKGKQDDESKPSKEISVEVILTGDLHHYSNYEKSNPDGSETHLITAGGGGAFMHPTHPLKKEIKFRDKSKAVLKDVFPSASDSKKLSLLNLAFPLYNWSMCLFLGIFHVITSWFIQSTAHPTNGISFMETMAQVKCNFGNVDFYVHFIVASIRHNPSVVILNLLLFVGILLFTDTRTGHKKLNYIAGFVHATAQTANLYGWIWVFSVWNLNLSALDINSFWQAVLFAAEMILIGGTASGLIFGIYLLVSTLVFKSHPTEASSSFRHEGYKNFLRIHISNAGLDIFPIGVRKIVKDWKNTGSADKPRFEGSQISYSLIEKEPITIKNIS